DSDRAKSAELISTLRRSKIEVKQAQSSFSTATAHTYLEKDSRPVSKTFPAGAYIVDLDQPQRILIKSILEPDTPQDQAFVDDNMARFRRNQMRGKGQQKEDYGFYDLTAWSLPLAFGVETWWTEDAGNVASNPVSVQSLADAGRGSVNGRAQVAYIIPYDSDASGAMALKLVQKGFRVAVANRKLNAGGRNWDSGTFVVRISRNPDTIHEAISNFAREMGVNVVAVNSGFSDEGDTSIGGEAVNSLQPAKIAVAIDDGLDIESFGSIWWTFDQYGIEFTPMTIANVRGGGLRDYNVLILPDGSAGRYMAAFGQGGVARLKEWVSNGGTLITIRGASVFAALKDVALTSAKLVGSEEDDQKGKAAEEKPAPPPTASPSPARADKRPTPTPEPVEEPRSERSPLLDSSLPPIASPSADANKVPEFLPGSIMRATVDRTVYLNYGVTQDEIPVLLASGFFFRYSREGSNALVFDAAPKKPLTVSGFVWEGNTENLLKGTAYLMDEKMGQGHVILFA
ncbi:MAG TPA: hypothetical protein DEA22_04220, partial [Blastocatellia bacterium]|nr:hypothetical protein [Blastocatellia bacterium]